MMTLNLGRRALISAAVAAITLGAPSAYAGGHQIVDSIHFIYQVALGAAGTVPAAEPAKL